MSLLQSRERYYNRKENEEDEYIDMKLLKHGYSCYEEYLNSCLCLLSEKVDGTNVRGGNSERNGFVLKYRVDSNDLLFSWPDRKTFGMYKPLRGITSYYHVEEEHYQLNIMKRNYYPCLCCGNYSIEKYHPFSEQDGICDVCGWYDNMGIYQSYDEYKNIACPDIINHYYSCKSIAGLEDDPLIERKMIRMGYKSVENYNHIKDTLLSKSVSQGKVLAIECEDEGLIMKYDVMANDFLFYWRKIDVYGMFKMPGGFRMNEINLNRMFGQIQTSDC